MHAVAEQIIEGLNPSVYEAVARGVLNDDSAVVVGSPTWLQISDALVEPRTLAILRMEGTARTRDKEAGWSSVLKVLDTSVDAAITGDWVSPEREEAVYEHGLFLNGATRLRPARCYRIDRPQPHLKVLWLEDLTEADSAPFSFDQLAGLLRDLGDFNGHHAGRQTALPFKVPTDAYLIRWDSLKFEERIKQTLDMRDRDEVRRAFKHAPLESAPELFHRLAQLLERSRSLPHSVCFGDCNPGNLFLKDGESVAIDWASLTSDPTGVDAGVLIGASMMWGRAGAMIAEAESELFAEYIKGLEGSGWSGDVQDVRRAYFGQFATILMHAATVINFMTGPPESVARWRGLVERRFNVPFEELPELAAALVARFPAYIDEVSSLLD